MSIWFSDRSDIVPRILSRQQRSSIIWRDKRGLTLRINEHKYQFSYTFLLTAVHKPPTGQKKKAWNLDLEELAVIWQKCCKIKWHHHLQKNLLPLIMRYQLRMELLLGLCLDSGFTLYFSCSGKKDSILSTRGCKMVECIPPFVRCKISYILWFNSRLF